jgi:hypothetical protein
LPIILSGINLREWQCNFKSVFYAYFAVTPLSFIVQFSILSADLGGGTLPLIMIYVLCLSVICSPQIFNPALKGNTVVGMILSLELVNAQLNLSLFSPFLIQLYLCFSLTVRTHSRSLEVLCVGGQGGCDSVLRVVARWRGPARQAGRYVFDLLLGARLSHAAENAPKMLAYSAVPYFFHSRLRFCMYSVRLAIYV